MTKLVSRVSKEVGLTDIGQKATSKGQTSQTIVDRQATNSPHGGATRINGRELKSINGAGRNRLTASRRRLLFHSHYGY